MRRFLLIIALAVNATFASAQAIQLVLGNPSDAGTDTSLEDNFLVIHSGFVLSYNRLRGAPNWVTWHLQVSDLGPIDRTNAFRTDIKLPAPWRTKKSDYNNSGYDRGHQCPSEDRSDSIANNRETFLMSNMQPQLHRLNGGTWKSLESYSQNLARQGFELYITAGCYGEKGRLKNKVTVPSNCWKIIVVLTQGSNDLERISNATRVIAVNMPNEQTILSGWRNYRTTVDDVERLTGYDFLSTLPDGIEEHLELKLDTL